MRILLCFLLCGLAGCQKEDENISSSATTLLIPHLDPSSIYKVEIEGKESFVSLVLKDEGWFVEQPSDVPAYPPKTFQVTYNLSQASRGQVNRIASSDYKKLWLVEPHEVEPESEIEPTSIKVFTSDKNDPHHFILGNFEASHDHQATMLHGEKTTARRYVWFPDSDTVFLSPESFASISSDPKTWEAREFPPLRDPRRLKVSHAKGLTWEVQKSSRFSAFKFSSPYEKSIPSAELGEIFREFLKNGSHAGTVPRQERGLLEPEEVLATIEVDSSEGIKYKIKVGPPLKSQNDVNPARMLSDARLKFGGAKNDYGGYLCEMDITGEIPQEDMDYLIHPLKERLVLISRSDIDPVLFYAEKHLN